MQLYWLRALTSRARSDVRHAVLQSDLAVCRYEQDMIRLHADLYLGAHEAYRRSVIVMSKGQSWP